MPDGQAASREASKKAGIGAILASMSDAEFQSHITKLRKEMWIAAERRDFEEAAELRDKIKAYEAMHLALR
jgi:excinuclease UvrABC helicase subunit UvrB